MLLRLRTTARMLHTTAHPDDEDGGMLTLESRGKGVTAILLTMNRGEGGQNKVGSNLFDVLGVLRTLELTASDRYYGIEQRFTRVADFGFSKSADETFQKWGGHDVALADTVRVIRSFRPDVIVSRFGGTERDGHGNHQASGTVSREAFRAAADPKRFPEQIKEGLLPWQARKLYIDNVCPFRSNECADKDYTVKLATGEKSDALGMTYIQFAMEGLKHQLSQGAGGWSVDGGPHFAFYRLVDSVLAPIFDAKGHELSFFDGIDTSLPGLAKKLGDDVSALPHLRSQLEDIDKKLEAAQNDEKDPEKAAGPLLSALKGLDTVVEEVDKSSLDQRTRLDLLTVLREKQEQCAAAANLAMGVFLEATVAPPKGPAAGLPQESEALTVVSPGQKFTVVLKFHNSSKYLLRLLNVSLDAPDGWITHVYKGDPDPVKAGDDAYADFQLKVPPEAANTRPYWHRDEPETQSINHVDDETYATLPFVTSQLKVRANYRITGRMDFNFMGAQLRSTEGDSGRVDTAVVVPFRDEKGVERERGLAVAPAFSVMLEPGQQVIPAGDSPRTTVTVGVSSNVSGSVSGTLRLEAPSGWHVAPEELPVKFGHRGEKRDFAFTVTPTALKEGRTQIRAVLESAGQRYSEGYSLVTRDDLDAAYYYQPATQRVSIVDVNTPKDLKVGYIMGAGDDIPTVLQQIGLDVTLIPAEKLASEDLSRYGTIILGIRAYDTQQDVATNNKRLLDYVSTGGTLVVQYETGVGDFNGGHFTPYPARLSRARVSVEEAPVEILEPDDSIFHYPNQITQKDFDGWVQERGLYFMDQWDGKFEPLLSCHDPGESPQKGGLLRAKYGKGTYIYTGYAFFRQLPAGVPGAVRLYVNLLSAGHEGGGAVVGRQSSAVGLWPFAIGR